MSAKLLPVASSYEPDVSAIGGCDLMKFRTPISKANVTSLLERTSRCVVVLPNANRRSASVIGRIGEVFGTSDGATSDHF